MLPHQRAPQRRRVEGRKLLEPSDLAGLIVERNAAVDFREIHMVVKSGLMPQLIVSHWLPGAAFLDATFDQIEIAVQKIDMPAVDDQPSAAIDPRHPFAEGRDQIRAMRVVELGGNFRECVYREWPLRPIIETEIVI